MLDSAKMYDSYGCLKTASAAGPFKSSSTDPFSTASAMTASDSLRAVMVISTSSSVWA